MSFQLTSCNDSFMTRLPEDSLTESTVFNTYKTFQTYSWGLYGVFTNGNISRRPGVAGYSSAISYGSDISAGYLMRRDGSGNSYAFQNISNASSGNGWDFSYIRSVNIMLDNIENSSMNDADKRHWRSVGYFFRAYYYSELIARFGDVPWVDHVIGDSDKEIAYGSRTPRKEVADYVLADLQYAEENIKPKGDGENTINVHAVRALISRFSLFEGTWRKYHELGDYEKYFDACIEASEKLITDFPSIHTDYGELFTSDLKGISGVILYKEYVPKIMSNYVLSHVERTSTHNVEMPQHIVDMYLCQDGKTISNSNLYEWGKKDKTMYSTFRNRDLRLLETVAPPYKVIRKENDTKWSFTDTPADREYMDILGYTTYTGYGGGNGESGKHKVLPLMNWAALVLQQVPHFSTNNLGQGFCVARSGYYVYKHYNVWDNSKENEGTTDVPIFKIEEVMLNYAEALYEKGELDQQAIDKSINKLRARVNVTSMTLSEINESFDPNRDMSVSPVLWEIRRERIIELMGEGFGFYDIRRWKKAEWFVNKLQYGQWAQKEDIGTNGKFVNVETGFADETGKTEGYIYMYNDPLKAGKGWLEKYYLYMVPTNEIALNPNLEQNSGW